MLGPFLSELFQEYGTWVGGPWLLYGVGSHAARHTHTHAPPPNQKSPRTEGAIEKVPVQRGSPLKSTHQRTPVLTIRLKLITHVTSTGKWIMASHCLSECLHCTALHCTHSLTAHVPRMPYPATTSALST